MTRILALAASSAVALALLGYLLYAGNVAPTVAPVSAADAAAGGKPYVVKLHAQWCPYCLVTKGVWSDIEQAYSSRAHLVVLDFTSDATTNASRAEAVRLGLEKFYDEFAGVTGTIVVLDARSKDVTAEINGSRDFAEYRAAIDAALKTAATP